MRRAFGPEDGIFEADRYRVLPPVLAGRSSFGWSFQFWLVAPVLLLVLVFASDLIIESWVG
jgi:hypothetical protein